MRGSPAATSGSTSAQLGVGTSHRFHYVVDGASSAARTICPRTGRSRIRGRASRRGASPRSSFTPASSTAGWRRNYWVYVPAQYNPAVPAALDGLAGRRAIHRAEHGGDLPAVPEPVSPAGSHGQSDSRQEDSGDDPRLRLAGDAERQAAALDPLRHGVRQVRAISPRGIAAGGVPKYNIRKDAYSRAIQGQSSGGIAAFTVAFNRPESFSRVYTVVGSFTALQWKPGELDGGNIYPFKVRREPKRNLRVWMNDGSEDQEANSEAGRCRTSSSRTR